MNLLVIFLSFVYFSPGIIFPKLHMTDSKIAQLCLSLCFLWGERRCPSPCRASLNLPSAQTSVDLDVDPLSVAWFQSAANEQARETEDTMMEKLSIDVLGQDDPVQVCWKHWSGVWCHELGCLIKSYEALIFCWESLSITCRSLLQLLEQGKPAQVWVVLYFHCSVWFFIPLYEKHRNNTLQSSLHIS